MLIVNPSVAPLRGRWENLVHLVRHNNIRLLLLRERIILFFFAAATLATNITLYIQTTSCITLTPRFNPIQ